MNISMLGPSFFLLVKRNFLAKFQTLGAEAGNYLGAFIFGAQSITVGHCFSYEWFETKALIST